ncbi:hypothetical protein [Halomonas aestuarii]|uniref:hypothetical protein n=1 Tax=Halomonas aestuarii TaxID=1897729 RepID=UPI000F7B44F5|nr:hypothetical protein [Halomonas aestuarii]
MASGPSLDKTDLKKIKNSLVVFVNHSVEIKDSFDESNFFIWFSADNERVLECEKSSKKVSLRLITIYKYIGAGLVLNTLSDKDVFLIPKPDWKALFTRFIFNVKIFEDGEEALLTDPLETNFITLYPRTGVLTLISISAGLGCRSIDILGFDATRKSLSYASGLSPQKKIEGFETKTIDKVLRHLREKVEAKGVRILNCSPLTELTAVEVSKKYSHDE